MSEELVRVIGDSFTFSPSKNALELYQPMLVNLDSLVLGLK